MSDDVRSEAPCRGSLGYSPALKSTRGMFAVGVGLVRMGPCLSGVMLVGRGLLVLHRWRLSLYCRRRALVVVGLTFVPSLGVLCVVGAVFPFVIPTPEWS